MIAKGLLVAAIFAVIIVIVLGLLAALPAITIDKEAVMASSAWQWVRAGMYFFPTGTVLTILTLSVGLGVFRLIIALIKTLWDLLPIV